MELTRLPNIGPELSNMFLTREAITEDVIAIKINRSYKENMSEIALYEATRGYWKLNLEKAKQADYAFCIYKGIIKEVYKIEGWLPAGSIPRQTLPDAEIPSDRYEFVGKVADKTIRNKYIEKSIANLYRRGDASPVRYFLKKELLRV